MRWSHIILTSCIAILVHLAQPAEAAWRGTAVVDVNMRSGPGVRYRVKAVVPRGARVNVRFCRRSWCNVRFQGLRGWVSRRYIARSGRRVYRRPRYRYRPPVYIYPPFFDDPYYDWSPIYYPPRIYRPRIRPRYRRYRGPRRPRYRQPRIQRPRYVRPRHRAGPRAAGRPRNIRPRQVARPRPRRGARSGGPRRHGGGFR